LIVIDPEGLLVVARTLVVVDEHRHKQANLRRAVSTAYYALFHALVRASLDAHIGTGAAKPVADRAARWCYPRA
jgi:hypothetical protein